MTTEDDLRAKAVAAGGVGWGIRGLRKLSDPWIHVENQPASLVCDNFSPGERGALDAEFIAAANPAAVLGLLDRLASAEAKLDAISAFLISFEIADAEYKNSEFYVNDPGDSGNAADSWWVESIRGLIKGEGKTDGENL